VVPVAVPVLPVALPVVPAAPVVPVAPAVPAAPAAPAPVDAVVGPADTIVTFESISGSFAVAPGPTHPLKVIV
jgi:hypothetical protein